MTNSQGAITIITKLNNGQASSAHELSDGGEPYIWNILFDIYLIYIIWYILIYMYQKLILSMNSQAQLLGSMMKRQYMFEKYYLIYIGTY